MRALWVRLATLGSLALGALATALGLRRFWRSTQGELPEGLGAPAAASPWRRRALVAGALLALAGAGGFLFAASGVMPIKASSGHWALTEWFLKFSMRRSITTHTLGSPAPPQLDDQRLVLRGAGHYETACRPCHGSPELRHPRIARAMLPPPPYLGEATSRWETDQLFYIVKHGLKFTGMPAWPTQQRDDEVWAMVAFLRVLPGLDAQGYGRLARGELPQVGEAAPMEGLAGAEPMPQAVVDSCGRCHGMDGQGRGAFPRLAGQRPAYLRAALEAYARGERPSGIMEPVAVALGPQDAEALARFYAGLQAPPQASAQPTLAAAPDEALARSIARGQEIATRGLPLQRIPACRPCHGPGNHRRNPAFPVLGGQYADYLAHQLQLFKEGRRGGSPYARLMRPIAGRLTAAQMHDVARYYASLGATLERTAP